MSDFTLSVRVGRAIAALRKRDGLTQAKLAEMLDIEKETLSRIETGKASPSLSRIEQISNVLNIPASELFTLHDTQPAATASRIAELLTELTPEQQELYYRLSKDIIKIVLLERS